MYLIGRIVVFEDPILSAARPSYALMRPDGSRWLNNGGLGWVNEYDQRVWRYVVGVGVAAAKAGFDEIQFDYVRFPSDGDVSQIVYRGKRAEPKGTTIARFLRYASSTLHPFGVRVSADVFGLAATHDLHIGQVPRRVAPYVDALYPMVYPSHFGSGEYGIQDPDSYPGRTVARGAARFSAAAEGHGDDVDPVAPGLLARAPVHADRGRRPGRRRAEAAHARVHAVEPRGRVHEGRPVGLTDRRDIAVVLSGGGMSGIMMELGFLQRLRESELWERVGVFFGASAGALAGSMAAVDRLDELERFLIALRPEEAFRAHTLWRLPLLGTHDYVLPRTIERVVRRRRRSAGRPWRRPSGSSS